MRPFLSAPKRWSVSRCQPNQAGAEQGLPHAGFATRRPSPGRRLRDPRGAGLPHDVVTLTSPRAVPGPREGSMEPPVCKGAVVVASKATVAQ